jgi:hypothetical protein
LLPAFLAARSLTTALTTSGRVHRPATGMATGRVCPTTLGHPSEDSEGVRQGLLEEGSGRG